MFNGLIIRRQSKNFCKKHVNGKYIGEKGKVRNSFSFPIFPLFIDLTSNGDGDPFNG